jgi:Methyltransferase small domain
MIMAPPQAGRFRLLTAGRGTSASPSDYREALQPTDILENSLIALGGQLRSDGYSFTTPTPATHTRVLRRLHKSANPLCNIFGWNRPFHPSDIPTAYRKFLETPLFCARSDLAQSKVRFSTLESLLVAHSAFPTSDQEAVFFGPDTYRFCRAIAVQRALDPFFQPKRVMDIGTGSGVGGLYAASLYPELEDIILSDVNPLALSFSRANSAINNLACAQFCLSDILESVDACADLIISNPPYLVDAAHRAYRDGGGKWGEQLALRILAQAIPRLTPEGRLLLYTGTPVVEGHHMFLESARPILDRKVRDYQYEELDPDVFGEELDLPPYLQADRIAAVVLHVRGKDVLR